MNDFERKVKDQMIKYGFTASDMTVTEFVEDILPTISKTESVECEDAVSRRAAYQKMMEMYKEDCEMYGVEIPECFDGHRAVRALMELPSVQPEIVRCKNCKNFRRNIPCVGGVYDGCDELLDEGNEMPVNENFYCGYAERRTDE